MRQAHSHSEIRAQRFSLSGSPDIAGATARTATGVGSSSDRDLIVVDTSDSGLDTVLISAGKRNEVSQALYQPVAFQLSVEPIP
jgi:hypothetical protein